MSFCNLTIKLVKQEPYGRWGVARYAYTYSPKVGGI